jgi:hypothetical protein
MLPHFIRIFRYTRDSPTPWPKAGALSFLEITMHYRNGREAKNGDRIV